MPPCMSFYFFVDRLGSSARPADYLVSRVYVHQNQSHPLQQEETSRAFGRCKNHLCYVVFMAWYTMQFFAPFFWAFLSAPLLLFSESLRSSAALTHSWKGMDGGCIWRLRVIMINCISHLNLCLAHRGGKEIAASASTIPWYIILVMCNIYTLSVVFLGLSDQLSIKRFLNQNSVGSKKIELACSSAKLRNTNSSDRVRLTITDPKFRLDSVSPFYDETLTFCSPSLSSSGPWRSSFSTFTIFSFRLSQPAISEGVRQRQQWWFHDTAFRKQW